MYLFLECAKWAERRNVPESVYDFIRKHMTSVKFHYQDNFTIAVVLDENGHPMGVGAAKRRPDDNPNTVTGDTVSLWRAFTDAQLHLE